MCLVNDSLMQEQTERNETEPDSFCLLVITKISFQEHEQLQRVDPECTKHTAPTSNQTSNLQTIVQTCQFLTVHL